MSKASAPYDREKAIAAFGSEEVLREASSVYLEEFETMLARVESAVTAKDFSELKESSHWIKGGMVYLHAGPAAAAAKALEDSAKAKETQQLEGQLAELKRQMERLKEALQSEV